MRVLKADDANVCLKSRRRTLRLRRWRSLRVWPDW